MCEINSNYLKLPGSYLFAGIKRRVDAYAVMAHRSARDVVLERVLSHVHGHRLRRGNRSVQKGPQPTAVVVVPMRQHRSVGRAHVDPERVRICKEALVGAKVKQHAERASGALDLEKQAQSVPGNKPA